MSASPSLVTALRPKPAAAFDRSVFLRPIAHRGLHNRAKGRIENTAPAFLSAIAKDYGIECDLQAAKDGTPMVFHDDRLERLVAASGPIGAYLPNTLARLRYRTQDTHVLTFAELLELVAGQVQLLVEVKKRNGHPPAKSYLEKIAALASAYRGPIALMSFDRNIVAVLGRLAPDVPRGLVVGSHQLPPNWWAAPGAASRGKILTRVLEPALPGLAFLAVDVKILRNVRGWMSQNAPELPLFSWTIRTLRQRAAAARWADAPIFEGYEA